jgi:hypothetical protein
MQFWEDVEYGLDDIAAFYDAKQQQQQENWTGPNTTTTTTISTIDRIRTFAKRYDQNNK